MSEIEPFPCAVLAHHYPDVPNLGDMTKIHDSEVFQNAALDVLVGGTPCQSFSVAGLRKGMADPRGNLALVFLGLVDRARPRWVVWENVPGVLSSNGGRDFGAFLGALGQLGYGFAYRVLDAQYFGVAQRRRRVFVVGHLGDWRRAAAVLFELDSLQGHPAPSREARSCVAGTLDAHLGKGGASADDAGGGRLIAHTLRAEGFDASEDGTGRGIPLTVARCLTARYGKGPDSDCTQTLIFNQTQITHPENRSNPKPGDPCHTLPSHGAPPTIAGDGVRRLIPRECERLQGFKDDYTAITYRGKPAADGPRYKALGNSMAVPVMAWIGRRIEAVDHAMDTQGENE